MAAAGKPSPQLEKLVQLAEERIDQLDYVTACKMLAEARQLAPDSSIVLDLFADALLGVGDAAAAKECLQTSIRLDPNSNASKFLNAAQLESGNDALMLTQRGVELLTNEFNTLLQVAEQQKRENAGRMDPELDLQMRHLSWQASSALVSVFELWTAEPLCDDPNAESNAEEALKRAHTICDTNPEVHSGLTTLRLLQQRPEEALAALDTCLRLLSSRDPDTGEDLGPAPPGSGSGLPTIGPADQSIEFHLGVAQLCIELGQFDSAQTVADGILEANSRLPQAWFLGAMARHLQGAETADVRDVAMYLENAEKHLVMPDDAPLAEQIAEIMKDIEPFVAAAGDSDDDEDEGAAGAAAGAAAAAGGRRRDADGDKEMQDAF